MKSNNKGKKLIHILQMKLPSANYALFDKNDSYH